LLEELGPEEAMAREEGEGGETGDGLEEAMAREEGDGEENEDGDGLEDNGSEQLEEESEQPWPADTDNNMDLS
jgi:hypothetical protein